MLIVKHEKLKRTNVIGCLITCLVPFSQSSLSRLKSAAEQRGHAALDRIKSTRLQPSHVPSGHVGGRDKPSSFSEQRITTTDVLPSLHAFVTKLCGFHMLLDLIQCFKKIY